MKLTKECIEAIEQEVVNKTLPTYGAIYFQEGATEALSNPEIYSKAGLISLEEMDLFFEWKHKYYRSESEKAMRSDSVEQEKEIFERLRNYTTAQLLKIYQDSK